MGRRLTTDDRIANRDERKDRLAEGPPGMATTLHESTSCIQFLELGRADRVIENPTPNPTTGRSTVLLLHGLAASSAWMWMLESRIRRSGCDVINWGYPSFTWPIPRIANRLAKDVKRLLGEKRVETIHFVAHSMGSIVVRHVLERLTPHDAIGRAVFLGPPNRGSRVARRFAPYLGWFCPPLHELSDEPTSDVHRIAPVQGVEVGIIAARFDHLVRIEDTHLPYETDHVSYPCIHETLVLRRDIADQVIHFLRTGRFVRDGDPATSTTEPEPSLRPSSDAPVQNERIRFGLR